ncbi:hypothetical protein JCM8097_008716 [Rhodosporidiobolus ruineniae]
MGFGVLHRNHFRKDWQRRVKTWFDQAGKKHSRREARQAKAVKAGLRPTELLRPAVRAPTVRYNRKVRAGRGFTKAELAAAGIRRKEALSLGVPVDHRRRNRSEEGLKINVERLEQYKARLVVFPKKAGKVKKGDTEGADKETARVASAQKAFPLPAAVALEQPREVTAEEKEFNAYTTLRKARSDARLVGVRAERKRKAEEEEESLVGKWSSSSSPSSSLSFLDFTLSPRSPRMASAPSPAPSAATQQQHWTTVTAYGDIGELSYLPLDPASIEQSVRSEKDGAVVSFVGYTRDNFQGRTVTHLTYESYVPLALKTLHHLLLEARDLPPPPPLPGIEPHSCASHPPSSSSSSGEPTPARIELGRIHVAHLLGPSPPLTPSIVITVSSPHRREAFYAAEWMLEMVKRRVQVWKREWYAAEERGEVKESEGGLGEGGRGQGKGEGEGEVFVGRDGEGPEGFGGRAHERHAAGGGGGVPARSSKWKENFPPPPPPPPAQRSAPLPEGG